ncbi:hypothetical protein HYPSUDRAFT_1084878 [Hypholoma sublateritium FD-334 SS-4]|uniref:Uncharacterized protein n=1 Tax=Hypholoma sublateritium (strain FD-334 SS-4) TaxID=945553 RepID=A0A0D2MFE7_HYPSF|nr:hypothetical protein HYPSUDRAFT_1084878 [Hypholoma sublateritium FD-334 SS-4]
MQAQPCNPGTEFCKVYMRVRAELPSKRESRGERRNAYLGSAGSRRQRSVPCHPNLATQQSSHAIPERNLAKCLRSSPPRSLKHATPEEREDAPASEVQEAEEWDMFQATRKVIASRNALEHYVSRPTNIGCLWYRKLYTDTRAYAFP